jgi:hypothetical protein
MQVVRCYGHIRIFAPENWLICLLCATNGNATIRTNDEEEKDALVCVEFGHCFVFVFYLF